jgi:hypothetical protein
VAWSDANFLRKPVTVKERKIGYATGPGRWRAGGGGGRNWKSGDGMACRWGATFLLDAEQRFNRIKGHGIMSTLVNALSQADTRPTSPLCLADDTTTYPATRPSAKFHGRRDITCRL